MDFSQIMLLNDDDKMKYLLEASDQLEFWEKMEIIGSFKNEDLQVACLTNHNISEGLDVVSIISSMKNSKLKVECLTNSNIAITPAERSSIVLSIEDDDIKISCLTDPNIVLDFSNKEDYATSLDDIIVSLINDEAKFKCLLNPDIALTPYEVMKVIISMQSEQLRINCLDNQELRLEPTNKAVIISSIEDDEKKLRYIQDESIGFNDKDRLLVLCSLQDEKKFEKVGFLPEDSYKQSLGLPTNMTIGVELEAEVTYAEHIRLVGKILNGWEVKGDGTLENGVEITSPILHSTENDMFSLATVSNIMQKFDLKTTKNCGRAHSLWCRFFR